MQRATSIARSLTSALLSLLLLLTVIAPGAAAAQTTAAQTISIAEARVTMTLKQVGLVGVAEPGAKEIQYYILTPGTYSWMIDPATGAAVPQQSNMRSAGTQPTVATHSWWWVYRTDLESPGQWLSVTHDGKGFRQSGRSEAMTLALQTPSHFASLHLEEAVRQAVRRPAGPLTAADLASVTQLRVTSQQVRNLAGIEQLRNLTSLVLVGTSLADLEPLASLTNLKELNLRTNKITDITPLRGLTQLESLYLDFNGISDLEPLRELTGLTHLSLWSNQIETISPLAGLTGLERLLLGLNQITEISVLQSMERLTMLGIDQNPIEDLTLLSSLTGLTDLYASGVGLQDLSLLSPLTSLTVLALERNQISDIGPLAGLTGLVRLRLTENEVADLSPLAELTELEVLSLGLNPLADLEPLSWLEQLRELAISWDGELDLSPLADLIAWGELADLTLDGRRIVEESPTLPPSAFRLQTENGIFLGDARADLFTLFEYADIFERVLVPSFTEDFGAAPEGRRVVFRIYGDRQTWLYHVGQTPYWGFNNLRTGEIFLSPWRQPEVIHDLMMGYQYMYWLTRQDAWLPMPEWFAAGLALHAVQRLEIGAEGWPNGYTAAHWDAALESQAPFPVLTANPEADEHTMAAVAFLLETRDRSALHRFFALTRQGYPFGVAFALAFGQSLTEFQAEYEAKVKDLRGGGTR